MIVAARRELNWCFSETKASEFESKLMRCGGSLLKVRHFRI
jgi:hypothetical protein